VGNVVLWEDVGGLSKRWAWTQIQEARGIMKWRGGIVLCHTSGMLVRGVHLRLESDGPGRRHDSSLLLLYDLDFRYSWIEPTLCRCRDDLFFAPILNRVSQNGESSLLAWSHCYDMTGSSHA